MSTEDGTKSDTVSGGAPEKPADVEASASVDPAEGSKPVHPAHVDPETGTDPDGTPTENPSG